MKSLLVHLGGSARDQLRLAVAADLARRFDAHATALFATVPPLLAMPYGDIGAAVVAQALIELHQQWRAQARQAFDAAGLGARGSWADIGLEPVIPAVAEQMLYADLSVLGQHDPQERDGALPADLVPAVLAASGRPALVLPYAGGAAPVGHKVLVAWKATPAAARAVTAALPLLRQAREVTVLSAGAPAGGCTGTPLDIERSLRLHGVRAELQRLDGEPPEIGEWLLSRAADVGADLLVMGCYGHSRAREFVLGGATRTVLAAMTLPVLMCH